MINTGNNFLYSGEWWLVVFPALALVLLCMSVNLLGDWLRDALNPKLRLAGHLRDPAAPMTAPQRR